MKHWLIGLVMAGALLVAHPASAHTQPEADPDDTRGALDLRRANFGHDDDKVTLAWWTYEPFGSGPFQNGGYLRIELRDYDYAIAGDITIIYRNGNWFAELQDGLETKRFPATRPFPRIARVKIPIAELPSIIQTGRVRWEAVSQHSSEVGPGSGDDTDMRVHRL